MQHNVVIETSLSAGGFYRADVVEAPRKVAKAAGVAVDSTRGSAYGQLALSLRRRFPRDTFNFLHVEV